MATSLGDGVRLVVLPLLALRVTDDPALVASVVVVAYLPALALGSIAGVVVVDRVRLRRLLVLLHLGRAGALIALAVVVLGDALSLPWLWAVALASGSGEAFADPGASALLPRIVPLDQLARANSRLQAGQSAAEDFVGRGLGGVLFAVSAGLPVLVDALLLLAAAGLVLRLPEQSTRSTGASPTERTTFLAEWRTGLRVVLASGLLRWTAVMIAGWNLSYGVYTGVVVLFAQRTLAIGPAGIGLLLSAAAVGSLSGALVALRVVQGLGAAAGALLMVLLSAAAMIGLSVTHTPWMAALLIAVDAFAIMVWNVLSTTARQVAVPGALLGRSASLTRTLAFLALPVGAGLGGVVAQTASPSSAFLLGAAAVMLSGAVALPGLWRVLRRTWPRGAAGPSPDAPW